MREREQIRFICYTPGDAFSDALQNIGHTETAILRSQVGLTQRLFEGEKAATVPK